MDAEENLTVKAAQGAFEELLELAGLGAQGEGPEGSAAFREEAQATVLMLIAAVVLADGEYDPGEQEFIRLLVDLSDKPGGEIRYLNDYASRWESESMEVPRFYRAAVQRDARDGTGIAWRMRCKIQLIGNYASISDGKFVPSERETVARYVAFLEEFADVSRTPAPGDVGTGSDGNGGAEDGAAGAGG